MDHTREHSYAGICFTPESVVEFDGTRRGVVVPRAAIESARLQYGFRAKHPVALAVLGLALIAIGLIPVPAIAAWFLRGGVLGDVHVWLVVWIFFGGWVLWQASRRGYLLVVSNASGGQRRLEFDSTAKQVELEAFLREVETTLGYTIER